MVRRVWWLAVLLVVSCAGMSSSSASSGPPTQSSRLVRETPSGPVWVPRLPYQLATPTPGGQGRVEIVSSDPRSMALAASGIPLVALNAYRSAAALIARSDPSCHLHWSLLAAIGRVESDHGRHAGSTIGRDGQVVPPILGPPLNGAGVALIHDSDGGRFDYDTVYDRAVGPMQFLPSTWRIVGVDGNDDGVADPGNIFDAALSAGRYLCAGSIDLNDPAQLRSAVFRYNHSASYVNLVLSLAAAYRSGGEPGGPIVVAAPPPTPVDRELPPATTGRPPAVDPSNPPHTISPSPEDETTTTEPPPIAWGSPPSDAGPPSSDAPPAGSSPPGGSTPSPPGRTSPPATPPSTSPPADETESPPEGTTSPTPTPTTPTPTPTPSGPSPTPSPSPSPTSPSPTPTPKAPVIESVDPKEAPPGASLTVAGERVGPESTAMLVRHRPDGKDSTGDAGKKPKPIPLEAEYDKEAGVLVVTLPDDLKPGPYLLTVTTDGASSDPVEIKVTEK